MNHINFAQCKTRDVTPRNKLIFCFLFIAFTEIRFSTCDVNSLDNQMTQKTNFNTSFKIINACQDSSFHLKNLSTFILEGEDKQVSLLEVEWTPYVRTKREEEEEEGTTKMIVGASGSTKGSGGTGASGSGKTGSGGTGGSGKTGGSGGTGGSGKTTGGSGGTGGSGKTGTGGSTSRPTPSSSSSGVPTWAIIVLVILAILGIILIIVNIVLCVGMNQEPPTAQASAAESEESESASEEE